MEDVDFHELIVAIEAPTTGIDLPYPGCGKERLFNLPTGTKQTSAFRPQYNDARGLAAQMATAEAAIARLEGAASPANQRQRQTNPKNLATQKANLESLNNNE